MKDFINKYGYRGASLLVQRAVDKLGEDPAGESDGLVDQLLEMQDDLSKALMAEAAKAQS